MEIYRDIAAQQVPARKPPIYRGIARLVIPENEVPLCAVVLNAAAASNEAMRSRLPDGYAEKIGHLATTYRTLAETILAGDGPATIDGTLAEEAFYAIHTGMFDQGADVQDAFVRNYTEHAV